MELEIHAQKLNGLLIASSISPVDENRRYLESDITIKKLEVQSEKKREKIIFQLICIKGYI